MIFVLLNGSPTPERLITVRLVVSIVVNRRPHCGHCRRRLIAAPSSWMRLSTTRESGLRQNGQYTWEILLTPQHAPQGAHHNM